MSDDSKDIKVETKTVVPDLDQSSGKAVPEEDRTHRAANASFDEQLFLDKIEKDPFQKELDEAIEQRNLSEFISAHDAFKGLYEFDAKTLEYPIEVNGV